MSLSFKKKKNPAGTGGLSPGKEAPEKAVEIEKYCRI